MILTVEVRRGDGPGRETVVGFVRILGPDTTAGRTDHAVGAVEAAGASGGPPRSAGCGVVGHDPRQGLWALLERTCAALSKADFVGR